MPCLFLSVLTAYRILVLKLFLYDCSFLQSTLVPKNSMDLIIFISVCSNLSLTLGVFLN